MNEEGMDDDEREEFWTREPNPLLDYGSGRERDFAATADAIRALHYHVACMMHHWEQEEWRDILSHLRDIHTGIQLTTYGIFTNLLTEEERQTEMRETLERKTGQPHKMVQVSEGVYAFYSEDVTVPVNMEEMQREWEGGKGK